MVKLTYPTIDSQSDITYVIPDYKKLNIRLKIEFSNKKCNGRPKDMFRNLLLCDSR